MTVTQTQPPDTGAPTRARTVVTLVEQACRSHPGASAVRAADGERTYSEVWQAALGVAGELIGLGVIPGDFVAVWAVKSRDLLAGIVGILLAGGAYVPLDPEYPRDRIAFIAGDARPVALVVPAGGDVPGDLGLPMIGVGAAPAAIDAELPSIEPGDAAYAIYTSGSTGRPKGVVVEHRSLVNFLDGIGRDLRMRPGQVLVGTAPIAFDASVPNLLLPLLHGATLCLPPTSVSADPYAIAALVEANSADVLKCSNSVLRMLCEIGWPGRSGLKVVTGGESLPPAVARAMLPIVDELWNYYGPTETTVSSTSALVRTGDTDPVPIGSAMPGVGLHVLDENGTPVAPGGVGELWISGAGVSRGYLNDEARTAECFVDLTTGHGAHLRCYRTGDLVRQRPDASLVLLGRTDDQVKLRGFRIELAEVEMRMSEHPDVLQAVTVVARNTRGDPQLAAFVRTTSASVDVRDLTSFASRMLPDYMVPSRIAIVDRFPLTAGGKIDRHALVAADTAPIARAEARPLRTITQQRIAAQISSVLRIPVERLHATDDFFELGGHSIRAVELMGLLARDFDVQLPLSTLLTDSTVEALADAVDRRLRGELGGPLVQLRTGHGVPWFFVHDGTGELLQLHELLAALPPGQAAYGLQMIGVDRAVPALHDLDTMVDRYIREVRAVLPDGPFVLGGFSLGGVIAYLMAARLAEHGLTTQLVALLDTEPPRQLVKRHSADEPSDGRGDDSPDADRVARRYTDVRRASRLLELARPGRLRLRVRDGRDLVRDRLWRLVAVKLWVERGRVLPRLLHNPGRVLIYALARHPPLPPYAGRVVLWWGDHAENAPGHRASQVWRLVLRDLGVRVVTGEHLDHRSFLKGRVAATIADELVEEVLRTTAVTPSPAPDHPGASGPTTMSARQFPPGTAGDRSVQRQSVREG